MANHTPEGYVKRETVSYLRAMGWLVFHVQQGMMSYPGISDLIAIKKGVTVFIEIKAPERISLKDGKKRPAGKLSEAQAKFMQDVVEHGGLYRVVYGNKEYTEINAMVK